MNAHSFTSLCVDRQDSGSGRGRATEAAWQQCSNGSRAAALVAEGAASQQAASSRVAGWQDISGRGGGRAVAAEEAWQWQCLHEGGGSSAEAAAGQQGGRGSAAAAGWC
jgi:hypothetical protein